MNTLDVMLKRRSCRSFTSEQVTDEELNKILIAANSAPIGSGKYDDVVLVVLKGRKVFDKIEELFNAKVTNYRSAHPLYNCQSGIMVCAPTKEAPAKNLYPLNVGCVMENMLLEATELNLESIFFLGSIAIAKNNEEFVKSLGIPEGYEIVCMAGFGHGEKVPEPQTPTTSRFKTITIE